MVAQRQESNQPAIGRDEVQQVLGRILESKPFTHAPKKQRFLQFIVDFYIDGRASELNEYLLGIEVFGRSKDGYHPATDPVVRVGAHEVRKKLEIYYQHEGANDNIRLNIPVGSYEPIFFRYHLSSGAQQQLAPPRSTEVDLPLADESTEAAPSGLPQIPAEAAAAARPPWTRPVPILSVAVALLLIVVTVLLVMIRRPQPNQPGGFRDHSDYGVVWQPFLKSLEPTLVVLSNPVVYRLLNGGDSEAVARKSVKLTPEDAAALAQSVKNNFAFRNGSSNPRLVLADGTYTGIGEAIAMQRVTALLASAGKNSLVKLSRTVSAEDVKNHHVILLGSVWSNEWSGKLEVEQGFAFSTQATIEDRNSQPGERASYRSRFDEQTQQLVEDYALVTVTPNITRQNVVMIIAGLRSAGTEAAAEFVTNQSHLEELSRRLNDIGGPNGPPKYYQALLRVGVENGIPTTIALVTVRELKINTP